MTRRHSRVFAAAVAVVVVLSSLPARAQEAPVAGTDETPLESLSPLQRLRRGQNLFEFGDCEGAVPVLEGVAHPGTLGDEKQLVEVYRMLGVCLVLDGQEEGAVRRFEQLLYIDPSFHLDPFRTPPPVVELFDRVKASIQAKQELIEQAKRETEGGERAIGKTLLVERERVFKETPFATVFLPFGLAQWANDEPLKGVLIGGGQALALGLNIASYWTMQALKWDGATLPGEVETHNIAQVTQAVALVGLFGVYLYGVGDAWWNHQARREVQTQEQRRVLDPKEAAPLLDELSHDVE